MREKDTHLRGHRLVRHARLSIPLANMQITDIEVIPLTTNHLNPEDCDGQLNDFVVRIHTDTGHIGIGESDTPPRVSAALVNMETEHIWARGFRDLLVGRDPRETTALWDALYQGCIYHTRRGLGVNILSAIDVALHDVAARSLGLPVYKLLGGAQRRMVTPYCSILPGTPQGRSWSEIVDRTLNDLQTALSKGYHAFKIQALFYEACTDRELAELVHACRRTLGPDRALMIDVGYRWDHASEAIRWTRKIECDELYFLETPIATDNIEGYAQLAAAVDTPIAMGELLSNRFEFLEYIRRGAVDVLQPDIGRAGGLTEARRIAQIAADNGLRVVPHGWKTMISVAALTHFSAAVPNCPYIEFPDPDLVNAKELRNHLAGPEAVLVNGRFELPQTPGLGVALDSATVEKYRIRN